jgi:hypothetical protein
MDEMAPKSPDLTNIVLKNKVEIEIEMTRDAYLMQYLLGASLLPRPRSMATQDRFLFSV